MIERFTKGNPDTVRKMNLLVETVENLARMTGDGFVVVQHGINGATTISLSMNELKARFMNFGGGVSYGNDASGSVGWFKLTDVGSNPMVGILQTVSNGSFSNVSGAGNTSVYIHPGSALANYSVNGKIFASFVGDSWVSVNIFSSGGEVEDLMANLFDVCEE